MPGSDNDNKGNGNRIGVQVYPHTAGHPPTNPHTTADQVLPVMAAQSLLANARWQSETGLAMATPGIPRRHRWHEHECPAKWQCKHRSLRTNDESTSMASMEFHPSACSAPGFAIAATFLTSQRSTAVSIDTRIAVARFPGQSPIGVSGWPWTTKIAEWDEIGSMSSLLFSFTNAIEVGIFIWPTYLAQAGRNVLWALYISKTPLLDSKIGQAVTWTGSLVSASMLLTFK